MNIVSAEQVDDALWDAFCDASPWAWTRHLRAATRIPLGLGDIHADYSFAIVDEGELLAVAPLAAREAPGMSRLEFGYSATPVPLPALLANLSDERHERVLVAALAEIDRLAMAYQIVRTRMFVDPMTEPVLNGVLRANPLSAFGYSDTSMTTACMDLSRSEQDLWSAIPSRRRRYIAAAQKDGRYTLRFFDSDSITQEASDAFEMLYAEAAGEHLWAPARWTQLWQRLRDGHAYLALVYAADHVEPVAGHYYTSYKRRSYDGLSAIAPVYRRDHALGPYLQWETIRFLQSRCYTHYELGWLFPEIVSEEVYSLKELAISRFKAGFGAMTLPFWRGEKYYNEEYRRARAQALATAFATRQGNAGVGS